MDSGLFIGYLFEMLVAGLALAAIAHAIIGKLSVAAMLGSAAAPVLLDLAYETFPWENFANDFILLVGTMLPMGMMAAMVGALVGSWLGIGARRFIDVFRLG